MTPTRLSPARTLLSGFAMVESARWHDDRPWFAHWGVGEVVAADMTGRAEVVAPGPRRMGWSIAWLPDDGATLVVAESVAGRRPRSTSPTTGPSPAGACGPRACNEFEGIGNLEAVQARRSARVDVTGAPVPRAT